MNHLHGGRKRVCIAFHFLLLVPINFSQARNRYRGKPAGRGKCRAGVALSDRLRTFRSRNLQPATGRGLNGSGQGLIQLPSRISGCLRRRTRFASSYGAFPDEYVSRVPEEKIIFVATLFYNVSIHKTHTHTNLVSRILSFEPLSYPLDRNGHPMYDSGFSSM